MMDLNLAELMLDKFSSLQLLLNSLRLAVNLTKGQRP